MVIPENKYTPLPKGVCVCVWVGGWWVGGSVTGDFGTDEHSLSLGVNYLHTTFVNKSQGGRTRMTDGGYCRVCWNN